MGPSTSVGYTYLQNRRRFIFQSSLACCGIYSLLLGTLLCVLNSQVYVEEKWKYFYLDPSIPDHLQKLNFFVVLLIFSGLSSLIGFRMRNWLNCCKDFVERVEISGIPRNDSLVRISQTRRTTNV